MENPSKDAVKPKKYMQYHRDLPKTIDDCLDELEFKPKTDSISHAARLNFKNEMNDHVESLGFERLLKTDGSSDFDLMVKEFIRKHGSGYWSEKPTERTHNKSLDHEEGISWKIQMKRIEDQQPDSRFLNVMRHIFHLKAQSYNRRHPASHSTSNNSSNDERKRLMSSAMLQSHDQSAKRTKVVCCVWDGDCDCCNPNPASRPIEDPLNIQSLVSKDSRQSFQASSIHSSNSSNKNSEGRSTGSTANKSVQKMIDKSINKADVQTMHRDLDRAVDKAKDDAMLKVKDTSMKEKPVRESAKDLTGNSLNKSVEQADNKTLDGLATKSVNNPVQGLAAPVIQASNTLAGKLMDKEKTTGLGTSILRTKVRGPMADASPSQGGDVTHSRQPTPQPNSQSSKRATKGPFVDEGREESLFISDASAPQTPIGQPLGPDRTPAVSEITIPEPLRNTYLRVTASCRRDLAPVHVPYDAKANTERLFRSLTRECPIPAERAGRVSYMSATFTWDGEKLLIRKGREADLEVFRGTIVQAWEEDKTRFGRGCKVEMLLHVDD